MKKMILAMMLVLSLFSCKKGWEQIYPEDRFVAYYTQTMDGFKCVVVRDDIKGTEYLMFRDIHGPGMFVIQTK